MLREPISNGGEKSPLTELVTNEVMDVVLELIDLVDTGDFRLRQRI